MSVLQQKMNNSNIQKITNFVSQHTKNEFFFIFYFINPQLLSFLRYKHLFYMQGTIDFKQKKNLNVRKDYSEITTLTDEYTKKYFSTQLAKVFFFANNSSSFQTFKTHYQYKLLFQHPIKKIFFVSNKSFIKRWDQGTHLLLNIFYFEQKFIIFGSPQCIKEVLSFNWNQHKNFIDFWKLSSPLFIAKTQQFNYKIDFFFKKLFEAGVCVSFITDCNYHFKNLVYFEKHNYFSIAPTTANLNPWLVSFSFPVISFSILTQYFFLNFLLISKLSATKQRFNLQKKLWNLI